MGKTIENTLQNLYKTMLNAIYIYIYILNIERDNKMQNLCIYVTLSRRLQEKCKKLTGLYCIWHFFWGDDFGGVLFEIVQNAAGFNIPLRFRHSLFLSF